MPAAVVALPPDDRRLLIVAIAAVQEQRQDGGDPEEDAVHDAKGKGGLEHGAVLVHVDAVGAPELPAIGAEWAQRDVEGGVGGGEVGAVGACDAAQGDDRGDEGADEAEVDEGDEEGGVLGARVGEEGVDGVDGAEHGGDEEDEYVIGREEVVLREAVDKVREHAQGRDERNDLEPAPEGEEEAEEEHDGYDCLRRWQSSRVCR